jgi:hypothetical protein
MKGRSKRASGGVNQDAQDKSQKSMSYTSQNNVEGEAKARKTGGKVSGMKASGGMCRTPRKSGGRLAGGDWMAAQSGTPAKGRNVSGSLD